MYKILIQDQKTTSNYHFYLVKEEETTTKEVDDGMGGTTTVTVGTGKFNNVVFETADQDKLEEKFIELLQIYNVNQLIPIDDLARTIDVVWS